MKHKYSFIWTAYFDNEKPICQFDVETGRENSYQLVKDRFNSLVYFVLWNKDKMFSIDLKKGIIYSDKGDMLFWDKDIDTKPNLIIWRRIKEEKNISDLKTIKEEIKYIFGFSYVNKNKEYKEILFIIDSKGNLLGE